MNISTIQSTLFYASYKGHPLADLEVLHRHFRGIGRRIVWLVGDSSLDNKHWLFTDDKFVNDLTNPAYTAAAVNGYQDVLLPPRSVKDVCYAMNTLLDGTEYVCINAAVEEACLADSPNAHDTFVAQHMGADDVLICSIGCNDIALKPSASTLAALAVGNYLVPRSLVDWAARWAPLNPLYDLFYTQTKAYVERFRAAHVLVCTIYFPCETGRGWANQLLTRLDTDKMRDAIRACHQHYHAALGTTTAVALYDALDPTDPDDYKCRVEPSVQGGAKMAALLVKFI